MKPLVILILTLAAALIILENSQPSNSDNRVSSNQVLLNVDPCSHPDYAALVAFYNATNGPGWSNSSNWMDTCDVCMWYGVRCNSSMRVEEINLYRNNLTGALPPEIGELSALKNLDLGFNVLDGIFPEQLTAVPLKRLELSFNLLSGPIPASIANLAPTLEELALGNNNFTGDIPPEIGNLTNLTFLVLENNLFSGSIPSEIGSLINVEYFYAGGNNITGIPPEIGNMTSLKELYLFFSQLTGSIPRELGNLPNLEILNLEYNNLSGDIPAELGNILTLTSLALTDNDLSGPIPASFSMLSNLRVIYLADNQLSGPLLSELGTLSSLTRMELSNNNFEGCIPESWRNLCPSYYISFRNNPCLWPGTFNQFCIGASCSFNDYSIAGSPSNVICFGSSTDIVASGGSAYLWSTGATTSSITESPQLDSWYYLTLTTPAGCTRVDSILITVLQSPVSSASGTDVTLAGGNDGTATIVVMGGQSPYSYIWNTGAIESNLQNLTIGTYSCTITDANGCIDISSVIINEPACLPPATQCDDGNSDTYNDTEDGNCNCLGIPCPIISHGLEINNVSCFAGNDGSASVNPTGGNPPYTVNWSSGTSGPDISNLSAGEYAVSLTDAHGCHTVTNFVLSEPSSLSSTLVEFNESVPGATDGSIEMTMSGGTPPYAFSWSNGETTEDISGLPGANTIYSVTVTDARGCQITDQGTLETGCFPSATLCDDENPDTYNDTEDGNCNCQGIPCPVILNVLEINNVSCFGGNDGSASVSPSGGNPPFAINWFSGTSGPDISNLSAGAYTVSVSDVNGCQSVTDFILSQPFALASTIARVNESVPGATDGSLDLRISGGTMPYDFMWSTGETTRDISGLTGSNTIYLVTITDAQGCQITDQVTLQTGCFPPATLCDDGNPETYNDTEDGNCICIGIPCPIISDGLETSNVSCFGRKDGSASVNPSGGIPPYTINWSSGASGPDDSNLSAGAHTVSVSDAHGCQSVTDFVLSQPLALSSTVTRVSESVPGATDGSINLRISGGTMPYVFKWNTGETTPDISGLPGANTIYSVTVTDARGCQITDKVTLQTGCFPAATLCDDGISDTYNDIEDGNCNCLGIPCPAISDGLEIIDVSCFGGNDGSASVNPSGGNPPYTINWSSGASGMAISNLPSGDYTVSISDTHGCQIISNFVLSEPLPLSSAFTGVNESEPGVTDGSIDLTISGGTVPYDFLWSSGETTRNISGLTGANTIYSVTVTDARGCQITDQVTLQTGCFAAATLCDDGNPVTYNDTEDGNCNCLGIPCPAISDGLEIINVSCFGGNDGSVSVNPSGGNPPYTIEWSLGASGPEISNLSSGNYVVSISDTHGCQIISNFVLSEPLPLSSAFTGVNESEPGVTDGSIDLTISGGTVPYDFLWSTGETTRNISGLTGANTIYSVTVTDARGCQITDQVTLPTGCFPAATLCDDGNPVTYNDTEDGNCNCLGILCPAISDGLEIIDVSCFGGSDGSASVNPSGGIPPYTINWSSGASGPEITNLSSGNYVVSVTDAYGCQTISNFILSEPVPLSSAFTGVSESEPGATDGSIDLTISGGTVPYDFLWSTGETTRDISGLTGANTIYSVTVTDARGCQITDQATLQTGCFPPGTLCDDGNPDTYNDAEDGMCNCIGTVCPQQGLDFQINHVNCFGQSDGSINLDILGITYKDILWSTGSKELMINGLPKGTYSLTITLEDECMSVYSFQITEPPRIEIVLTGIDESAVSAENGSASANIIGGTGPYQISWSNGSSESSIQNLVGNQFYYIQVKDQLGCIGTDSIYIAEFFCDGLQETNIEISTTIPNNCEGNGEIAIKSISPGGDLQFSLDGLIYQSAPRFKSLSSGTYQLFIKDPSNGCLLTLPDQQLGQSIDLAVEITEPTSCEARDGEIAIQDSEYEISFSENGPWYFETIDQLSAGNYRVFARKIGDHCIYLVGNFELGLSGLHLENLLTISRQHAQCNAGLGKIEISPIDERLEFSIDQGSTWYQRKQIYEVSPGVYDVRIRSDGGCSYNFGSIEVDKTEDLKVQDLQVINPSNCNSRDGFVEIQSEIDVHYSLDQGSTWTSTGYFTDLAVGEYRIWLRSSDETCRDSLHINLTARDENLQIMVEEKLHPSCPGAEDGYIRLTINDNPSGYNWSWSDGSVGQEVGRLLAGSYEVFVSKNQFCRNSLRIDLIDPPPLDLNFPPIDTVIYCQGQSIMISLPDSNLTYNWYRNDQFVGDGNHYKVSVEGQYSIVGLSVNGCEVSRTFDIAYSNQIFDANFLISGVCLAGEPTPAIEISWPVPDDVIWEVEGGSIVDTFLNQSIIIFEQPGNYVIRMKAMKNGCMSVIDKMIKVVDDPALLDFPANPLLMESIQLNLFPNPNRGNFNVLVELSELSDLQLRIYNEETILIYSAQFPSITTLSQNIDLMGSVPGLYTLVVQTNMGWKTISFIID